jgi:hypothetical protein
MYALTSSYATRGSGLQSPVPRFDPGRRLQEFPLFRGSFSLSAVDAGSGIPHRFHTAGTVRRGPEAYDVRDLSV